MIFSNGSLGKSPVQYMNSISTGGFVMKINFHWCSGNAAFLLAVFLGKPSVKITGGFLVGQVDFFSTGVL
jgi:hypothetical protein